MLDLGGHTAARREGGAGRRAQLPILFLRFGFPQQGQHRPNAPRTAWRRCPTPFGSPAKSAARSSCASPPRSRCPFEGVTDPERVIGIAADPRTAGAADIVVCDTLGQAVPAQVADLIQAFASEHPQRRDRLPWPRHLGAGCGEHPCRDRGRRHDGGRLAGRAWRLPLRPRRQRQHLHRGPAVRHPAGLAHPRDAGVVVEITEKLLAELGEPNRSKTAQGARSEAPAFEWVIGGSSDVTATDFLVTTPIPEPGMRLLRRRRVGDTWPRAG